MYHAGKSFRRRVDNYNPLPYVDRGHRKKKAWIYEFSILNFDDIYYTSDDDTKT